MKYKFHLCFNTWCLLSGRVSVWSVKVLHQQVGERIAALGLTCGSDDELTSQRKTKSNSSSSCQVKCKTNLLFYMQVTNFAVHVVWFVRCTHFLLMVLW